MFHQCSSGKHEECSKFLSGRYFAQCDCPCHRGVSIPANPCQRCKGTGKYGPHSVEEARCFRCDGSGVEPAVGQRSPKERRPVELASGIATRDAALQSGVKVLGLLPAPQPLSNDVL